MLRKRFIILSALLITILVSCEDEEMVAKSREQEQLIQALRSELAVLKVKLDANWAKDPSRKLEEEEYANENLKGIIADLEEELAQLQIDRNKAEKTFSDYRAKYPVAK